MVGGARGAGRVSAQRSHLRPFLARSGVEGVTVAQQASARPARGACRWTTCQPLVAGEMVLFKWYTLFRCLT